MTNTISTTVNHPIVLDSSELGSYGNQLIITTSGDVAPTFSSGVFANESNDSINNAGTISGAPGGSPIQNQPGYGVALRYGTLTNTGMIFGGSGGTNTQKYIYGSTGVFQGANATGLTNQGTIEGGAGASTLQAGNGGVGISLAGGIVLNEAAIYGGAGGDGLAGAVSVGGNGGTGVVQSGASLLNRGTIKGGGGGTYGGDGGAGAKLSGGSLTNDNTIYGGAGGSNTGFFYGTGGTGGNGVSFNGGTLTNAGTIAGGAGGDGSPNNGAAGDAVEFGASAGTLIIDPGAVFIGDVVADSAAADVLVLASAATAGTLSGLGDQFTGFSTLLEDAGANWFFTGENMVTGTVLLAGVAANDGTISGDANLTVASQFFNNEIITGDLSLSVTGMLTNTGTINDDTGLTLTGALVNNRVIGGLIAYSGDGGNGDVAVYMNAGSLNNHGTIIGGAGGDGGNVRTGGAGGTGVDVTAGALTNQSTITGGAGGEALDGGAGGAGVLLAAGTITNQGTVTGGTGGAAFVPGPGGHGGAGIVQTGGSITNDQIIRGGAGGISTGGIAGTGGQGVALDGGALTNDKTITGGNGGKAYGYHFYFYTQDGTGGAGVYINGATLTNAGTIAGGAAGTGASGGAAGDAVQFGTTAGTLIVDPRAAFIGNVVAHHSVADVLILAPGGSVGTLSGLGSQFTGFATLDFAPNAKWTAEGSAAGFGSLTAIDGFTFYDTIVLDGFVVNPADTTYVTGTGLELTGVNDPTTLDFVGDYNGKEFRVTTDGTNTTIAICYLRGTRILTPNGEVAVENLAMGDLVVTRFGGFQSIRWIGLQSYESRFIQKNPAKIPVKIAAGAFGDKIPARDLWVSPGHSMLLDDILVLARDLINGVTVTQECPENDAAIEYFQIDLGVHDCVIAEGCWAETFADAPGLRAQFHNAATFEALYPLIPPATELTLCAPRPARGVRLEAALHPVIAIASNAAGLGVLEGYLDGAADFTIHGWARDIANPALPVLLEVWLADEFLGTVLARDARGDLRVAGKGNCAFTFTAPRRLAPAQWGMLRIKRAADDAVLRSSDALRQRPDTAAPDEARRRLVA